MSDREGGEEVIVELDVPLHAVPALSAVRSTIILSSIASIRAAGYFDAYRASLSAEHAPAVLDCVAGTWVALAAARAHYDACEALGLAPSVQYEIGVGTGKRAQGTLLGTTARLAKNVAGATPWTLIAYVGRFWSRAFLGSGIRVVKTGPKDARLEVVRHPLIQSVPYYRHSFRGFCTSLFEMFCLKMWFREQRVRPEDAVATFRAQWA